MYKYFFIYRYGDIAELIIEEIIENGQLTLEQIIENVLDRINVTSDEGLISNCHFLL